MDTNGGDAILGSWMSEGWVVRLDIRKENGRYFGRIAEGVDDELLDSANSDQSLRGRKVLGLDIVTGLEARGGAWKGGRIYDPQSGGSYSLECRMRSPDRLSVRGYVGLPFIGIAQDWSRAEPGLFPSADRIAAEAGLDAAPAAWPADKAQAWWKARVWPVGCNFIPSTAINELEMWQAESFDPVTIARELDLAAGLGFNTLRVYLHHLPWQANPKAFLDRIGRFLDLAAARGLSTLFVIFDDCWNDKFQPGRQPRPKKGIHNSGWVRCPGSALIDDEASWPLLEDYESGIVSAFSKDERVFGWDVYNELGNGAGFRPNTTRLLARSFLWARQAGPQQPVTSGIYRKASWYEGINRFLAERSDLVSFHQYGRLDAVARWVDELATTGKPLLCTEYMARSQGSRFETHLPWFRERGIGAINWGLVAGKSNTIYPWGSRRGSPEPAVWFHDIFRPDGRPWSGSEVAAIRQVTGKN